MTSDSWARIDEAITPLMKDSPPPPLCNPKRLVLGVVTLERDCCSSFSILAGLNADSALKDYMTVVDDPPSDDVSAGNLAYNVIVKVQF